jgi:subtilisin family serine protease
MAVLAPAATAQMATSSSTNSKLGPLARERAAHPRGSSQVIVSATDDASVARIAQVIQRLGGQLGRALPLLKARVAYLPDDALTALAAEDGIERISLDRRTVGLMERTGAAVRATDVRQSLGYHGEGVGVAIIDSGVTGWHDDLAGAGVQRVDGFVDFVNGRDAAYDDYGHGTHVAGIIAGNGFDSGGARSGIAPASHLVVLKALDQSGMGHISDVIAALDYIVANKDLLHIRVVNLSIAAAVYESYNTDPLTIAAKRVVEAGIVVVAAAGNFGHSLDGRRLYGAVTAPGNAPWVLTVGASTHAGTVDRRDDTMAAFSSRGPTRIDATAKPDLVAPGVGTESLSAQNSTLYGTQSAFLLGGTVATSYLPYLSLSGTSMSAPVVSGTVALMLQANPALTPNEVKAILQYTSEIYDGYDALTQGAGFLNAEGAVRLARFLGSPLSLPYPSASKWSKQLIWANHRIRGGRLTADASAWSTDVVWGAALTPGGQHVEWGVIQTSGSWTAWGSACSDPLCSTFEWGVGGSPNIVWGPKCGGADCSEPWTIQAVTVVWGTDADDTVVWGTDADDTVVWGTVDDDTVVWGTSDVDSIIWGGNK